MILERDASDSYATFGKMVSEDGMESYESLELAWADNQPNVSCIPVGTYACSLRFSPHHGYAVFGIDAVPGRMNCEIHAANLPSQLLGCVALGQRRGEIDGQRAILGSQAAVHAFMTARGAGTYQTLTSDAAVAAAQVPGFSLSVRNVVGS